MAEEVPPEIIEQLKGRDARFQAIDDGLAVEAELASSKVVQIIIEEAAKEAQQANDELITCNFHDWQKVAELQAKVVRARSIAVWINAIIQRGRVAQESAMQATPEEIASAADL